MSRKKSDGRNLNANREMGRGFLSRRWRGFLDHAGIRQQLYAIYFLAVVVPILLIGTFLLVNTHNLLVNYHTDLLESDNQRVRNVLFEITNQIHNISEDISFDPELGEVLSGRFGDPEWYFSAVDKVTFLDNYQKNYAEIEKIEIYTDNPYAEDYKQIVRATKDIMQTEWYQKANEQSGVFWEEMSWEDKHGNVYWNLCLIRKIPLVDSDYHAVLVIRISDNYLRTRIDSNEYISRISVDDGAVFYSSDRKAYGEKQAVEIDLDAPYYQYTGEQKIDNRQCFVTVSTFYPYQSESKIYICTVNEEGYASIRYIQRVCFIIVALSILFPGLIIYFFGRQINEKELTIQQQSMEFKMLASQINPHFLYNTLETIRMKAFTAGDREVATAIKLLGKSMRYVLENTGTSFTTLAEELAHVEIYIQIQRLRFGDRINFEKKIAEDVDTGKRELLPLLLQPVVENAVIHGLEGEEKEGHITVSVYRSRKEREERLFIDIEDDGEGMAEEALEKLRADIEVRDMGRSKSIGLYNINQRIKLHYGEEYGIQVYSKLHQGTTVRLVFPADVLL